MDVIASITDLSNAVSQLKQELRTRPRNRNPVRVFRGQAKDYPLIPLLGRLWKDTWDGRSFEEVESTLLDQFIRQYSSAFHSSVDRSEFPKQLNELEQWEWWALAQHHCLPTRLLDWSMEPKVALLFSVCNRTREEAASDGVLFAFYDHKGVHRKIHDPTKLQNVRHYRPLENGLTLPRIVKQQGAFTFQPSPMESLEKQLNLSEEQGLRAWRIPADEKQRLRQELENDGYSLASMFPGLDGMCREIRQKIFGFDS